MGVGQCPIAYQPLRFNIPTWESLARTSQPPPPGFRLRPKSRFLAMASAFPTTLPPALDSTSEPPSIFDGTTRLYISYVCPYAQRVWIARNYKGLQNTIKLVPIDLQNRPAWYKEKVYPTNKVPALEHNNKVSGESLDLLKYIEAHFEGPEILPAPKENLLKSCFLILMLAIRLCIHPFQVLETGRRMLVDIAYAPFIERFHLVFSNIKNYDITEGRPKLALWIEELNKADQTRSRRAVAYP